MEITSVDAVVVSIPLETPARFAIRTVHERDHAIVTVRTDDGHEGLGYTLGYGGAHLVADAVTDLLEPLLLGENPMHTERLWRELFDSTVQIGRMGVLQRALSIVDIALWDVRAKAADQPLYEYLGAYTDEVEAYATGGYYREGKTVDDLADEMVGYVERGHDAVKMKVGGAAVERDAERVRAVREAVGDDVTLLLDANCAYRTEPEAVRACRAFAEADPYFIEEPVMPDSYGLMRAVNQGIDYSVAAGELEFNRYGFERLVAEGAVDVVQADATVAGGVTEWLRIAAHASSHDVPMAPHYNWDLHAHLVASVENGQWVEYFHRDADLKAFDDVMVESLKPVDGMIELPDRPGHGVELDPDRVEAYRVAR